MRSRARALTRHVTKRFLVVALAVVVVGGAAGASAWAFTGGSNADFRTATATIGTVQQTLVSTGTLQPVNDAPLSFQVAGQVATVAVSVGQTVTAGQVLATLDTSLLSSAVDTDESQISTAQTKLDSDEATEAADSTSTTTTTTTTTTPGGSGPTGSSGTTISAAQATLTSDQHTADTQSAQAKSDLTQATATCGASSGSTCTAALAQVLTDQQTVATDEQAVATDESNLAKLLATSSTGQDDTGQDRTQSSDSGTSGSDSDSSVVSPYEIAADQATLDADEVQLSEAQASLDEGQIASPIAGVVASVGVTAGQNVSADSSTDQIVVIGPQAFEVSTTVDVSDVSEVTVGETAQVSVDGLPDTLSGKVSQVGPPPVSASSTDYPVVVTLPADTTGLFDGASASVSIVVGQATDVVTVPTSAVHLLGTAAFVSELRNGAPQEVRVTLGAMGGISTQVMSGIKDGATVVLANLSEPVPTNTTTGPGSFAGVGALTGTGFGGGTFRRSATPGG